MPFSQPSKGLPKEVTLKFLLENIIPKYFDQVPCEKSLRQWLSDAGIHAMSRNPNSKRGKGGPYLYNRASVENWLNRRTRI